MIKLDQIKSNPNNPRTITGENFKKLCKSIKEFPKMLELRPIIVDSDGLILGGNMRFRAITDLKLELKPEWFREAESLSPEEKRRFIVEDNVGFGEWDWEVLSAEYEKEELNDWGVDMEDDKRNDSFYVRDVKAPTYEPKNEKPSLDDLVSSDKTLELVNKINASKLPEPEKEFLKLAAQRHNVFNYSKIADYYAHAESEVKDLMEQSALIIIDYNKAVENGFVELIKSLKQVNGEDYNEL